MTDPHIERDLILGDIEIKNLRKLPDEDTLLGTVQLFGLPSHALFLRVVGPDDKEQRPTRDPYNRWAVLTEAEPEGVFQTVKVDGFKGRYVFFVSPFLR